MSKQAIRQRHGLPDQTLDVIQAHEDGTFDLAYPGTTEVIIHKGVATLVPEPPVLTGKAKAAAEKAAAEQAAAEKAAAEQAAATAAKN